MRIERIIYPSKNEGRSALHSPPPGNSSSPLKGADELLLKALETFPLRSEE